MAELNPNKFAEYMQEALYGEEGFYTLGGGAGRTRDYLTSPEVGDLFGYVVASYIDDWYDSLDVDTPAIVIEAGAGPGSLAASIARASLRNAANIDYRLVDISPAHRSISEEKLRSISPEFMWSVHETLPECDVPTLVIANELLDNLVFDIGRTMDVYQQYAPDRIASIPPALGYFGIHGNIDSLTGANAPMNLGDYRIPLHTGIAEWFSDLVQVTSNVTDLSLLFFDYIKSVTRMHDENWLRLYANNQRIVGVDNVLTALEGGVRGDITTDVTSEDMHVLLDTEGFSKIVLESQEQWLFKNGIDAYCVPVGDGSSYNQLQQWMQGDKQSLTSSSFARERETLMDENGLGAFTVITARRAI